MATIRTKSNSTLNTSNSVLKTKTITSLYQSALGTNYSSIEPTVAPDSENNGGFFGGLGYLGEKVGLGFLSGFEGIWDYSAGGIAKLFGADDWAEQQFSNDWVNYNHADEWFNPSEGWQVAGDVAGGIGTSLPALVGVAAGAAITYFSGGSGAPVAAKVIAASLAPLIAGLGAAGNATKEAYQETGILGGKEFGYGALTGVTEAGIELLTQGIGTGTGRIAKSVLDGAAGKTAKEFAETLVKVGGKSVIKNIAVDFASEALEEGVAEFISPYYKRMTYDPDAQNATLQEIAYASLVGGLSGAIMSLGGSAVNTTANLISGTKALESGSVSQIIKNAEQFTATENANDTGYTAFKTVKEVYEQLSESLKTTGGTVQTVKQKMLLGQLKKATTVSTIMPFVEREAIGLLYDADAVAQRYNEFGMTGSDGKKLTFTAEQIRSGVDSSLIEKAKDRTLTKAENRTLVKQIRAALTSNSTLSTLAVASATGHITMNAQKIAEAMVNGSNLVDSNTLNYFVENASQTEIAAASADLGIQDWSAITIDDVKLKAGEFTTSERGSEVMKQRARIRAASEVAQENTKALPHILRSNMADGVYRFSSANADVNMAVLKEGGTYHLYDYDSGNISRSLTVQEINKVLRTYWNTQGTAVTANATKSIVQDTTADMFERQRSELSRQAAEIDTLATESIPEYKQLSEPNKQAVRMTIRQAQKYGIDSDTYTTMARVAARSGLNVVFNAEKTGAGNALFDGRNTIYVDPNAPAERMRSKLLLHEAGHAIFKSTKAQKLVEQAYKNISPESAARVVEQYTKLYEEKGMDISEYAPIVSEEIAAKGIEDVLGSERAWEYILSEEPTTGEKFLSFFKKAARDYSADEKLSSAARKMLREYKKMFDKLSAQNYGNNAIGLTAGSFTNSENMHDTQEKVFALSSENDDETRSVKQQMIDSIEKLSSKASVASIDISKVNESNIKTLATETIEALPAVVHTKEVGAVITDKKRLKNGLRYIETADEYAAYQALVKVLKQGEVIFSKENHKDRGYSTITIAAPITFVDGGTEHRLNMAVVLRSEGKTYYKMHRIITESGENSRIIKNKSNVERSAATTSDVVVTTTSIASGNSISQKPANVNTKTKNKPKKRYALPDSEVSEAALAQMRTDYEELQRQTLEAKKKADALEDRARADELSDIINSKSSTKEEQNAAIASYKQWSDESGYTAAQSVYKELESRRKQMYRDQQRMEERLSEMLLEREYTPEEVSKYVGKAVRKFHTTTRLKNAGYLLTTGSMLDFSEGRGYRVHDHREISDILDLPDYAGYSTGMYIFMNMGNIRLQSYGIDLSAMPNSKQINALRGIIQQVMAENDAFSVDFSKKNGFTDGNVTYPKGIASSRIINDIKTYFETGTIPESPDNLSEFRYALPELDAAYMEAVESGDMEAAGKMVEQAAKAAGYTIKAYHGTTNRKETSRWNERTKTFDTDYEKFTVFKKQYDEQVGHFFASDKDNAGGYGSTVYDVFLKLSKPLEIDCNNGNYDSITYNGMTKSTEEWAEYAKQNGYNGVIFKNVRDGVGYGDLSKSIDEYVAFFPVQIKSADHVTYSKDGKVIPLSERFSGQRSDIRYALPETDSEGNTLSEQQREYFADTKVVDENGNLRVMYRGEGSDVLPTVFDRKKSKPSNLYGRGFYFTDSNSHAGQYGNVREYYLNITNPVPTSKQNSVITRDQMRKFLNSVAENGDYSIENYGTYDIDKILDTVFDGRSDFAMLQDVNATAIGDLVEAIELFNEINGTTFDGIILDTETVTFQSEQSKLTSNKTPTADKDIRYALDDPFLDDWDATAEGAENAQSGDFDAEAIVARGLPRSVGEVNLTVGELRKIIANNTRQRVYSKKDAISVVKRFAGVSDLTAKTRGQIADAVWQILNESPDIAYRRDVAHDMAEFIVAKIIVDSKTVNPDAEQARENLSYLRTGIGRLSFSPEDISEIRHIRDKDGLRRVLGRWGYKGSRKVDGTNGMISTRRTPMDVFVTDIAREMPAMSHLEEMHPVDAFMEIDSMYEQALANSKDKWISAYWDMPDSEIPTMIKDIEDTLMQAYESEGEQSKFSRFIEENISRYVAKAEYWKSQYEGIKGRDRILGLLMSKAQQMKDLRLGTFANSTQHDSEVFKNSIEKLARIQFRGNLNVAGTRKVLAELRSWYHKENQMLEYQDSKNNGYYEQSIADMLDTLANRTKPFTKEDLSMLYDVMSYFVHFVENWGKVFRNGKWIDALPEAQRYIDTLHTNEQVKVGLFKKIAGTSYAQTFFDPMTVARRMDMYENGFFTESMEALRDAAVDAQVAEMELRSAYDEFNRKHKNYVQTASTETVEYRGTKIQKLHLIGLYMTMKRKHAQAGLVLNGYAYWGADGNKVRVNGVVAPDTKLTDAEVEQYAKAEMSAIEKLLTDTDKEYIAILEQAYNVDARKLKADRDMQRLGFTNATNDYYYPIRRGNISKNVDTSDIAGELDRVSSASFNKDTVRGAKQELFIESADVVFNRHIHAVCQYAHLSPAIETYNRLYNLDISGNPNKPISVRTESENTWDKGNQYFVKMISDIQGIPATSSEGMAALTRIRSGYAKYQLGANPKVWFTQLSSFFASSSILDADSIARGMAVSSKGIDEYCSLAKLRNNDNTAALAQGVLDSGAKRVVKKIDRFSDALMVPIGKMDRFVVRRLFGACQIQVQKNGGAKVGTEANKVEAGKLLRRVILETQQNSIATERSAAMRSGNEIMRTITMFSSDSMKVIGRVIDSYGEFSTLKAKLKMTTDAAARAELKTKIGAARKQFAKSVGALVTSAAFMAAIAQLFRHIYDKEQDEDESVAETMLVDAVGNLFGGLPIIKDVVSRITDGYEIDNYAYSAVNDLINSAMDLFSVAEGMFGEDATVQDRNRALRNLAYSVGQVFGIPVRNVYNTLYGLTKRFNPETAYMIDNTFYKKNYQTELAKAIEADDADQTALIMDLLMGERVNGDIDSAVFNELLALSKSGQSVIPRTIPDSLTIGDVEYPLSMTEQAAIKDIYSTSQTSLKALFAKPQYASLSDEQKAEAIDFIYSTYYDKALQNTLGIDRNNNSLLIADVVGTQNLALLYVTTKSIKSDTDRYGNTIDGSKRKKVISAINELGISTQQKLLLICAKGYALKDGDIRGLTAEKAKKYLLRYILTLQGKTSAQKAAIAEMCGFEVKNGRIITKNL